MCRCLETLRKKSFEDTKVVIRSRNSKDRQKQWPTEKYKQRCIKHYTENKDRATRTKNSSLGADPRGGGGRTLKLEKI